MARRAALSVGTLRDLEQGRSRHPRIRSLRALADALELSGEDLARLQGLAAPPRVEPAAPVGPVRICVLGPLTMSRSTGPVELGAGRHRIVLARLAITPNRPVSNTELINLLWCGTPPPSAVNVLQAQASRLRRMLESARPDDPLPKLVSTPGGYCLRVEESGLDLLAYRARLAQWSQLSVADPHRGFDVLLAALELWCGQHAAEDVAELRDDPLVTNLSDEMVEATIGLGALGERLHRLPEALPLLRRLAARHPWHEALHARFIVALAACGQQAAAFEAYDMIRRRLADELGIDPGAALVESRQAVLDRRWEQ